MRRALALTALAAGAFVPAVSATAQDPGGVGIRLLEAPTSRADDPRARRSIVDHVKPATTFSRRFEVSNTTSGQRLIAIYAAGADVVGGMFVPADGRAQNELSGWITVDTTNADLPAGQTVQPRLTIAVPPTASAGERYAVVWAELPPSQPPPGGGPSVVNRVGIRVYLSVGPGAEPSSDFVVESLTAERDPQRRPVVKASVRNTGGRALDLDGTLRLTNGPNGLSAGPFPARLGTTLGIGATAPVAVPLDPAIVDGPWRARIELRSGTVVRAAAATITFPTAAGSVGTPVTVEQVEVDADDSSAWPPWPLVALAVLLIAMLLVALVLLRRRRRTKAAAKPEPAPAPAPQPAPAPPAPEPAATAPVAAAAPARRPEPVAAPPAPKPTRARKRAAAAPPPEPAATPAPEPAPAAAAPPGPVAAPPGPVAAAPAPGPAAPPPGPAAAPPGSAAAPPGPAAAPPGSAAAPPGPAAAAPPPGPAAAPPGPAAAPPSPPSASLDTVLAELRTAEGARREELIALAAAYGKDAILASPGLRALPVETARALGEHVARTGR